MADAKYYSTNAISTTLSGSLTNSATSIGVTSVSGFPTSYPYTLVIDPDTANMEAVSVTNAVGTTLTATRGIDGTTGVSHAAAAPVRHMVIAEDLRLSRQHEVATTGVHGLSGAPVGTTDTQTLANKTLTTPTIGSFTNAQHTHANAAGGGLVAASGFTLSNYTPAIVGHTTDPVWTYATQNGRYSTMGKLCYFYFHLKVGVVTSAGVGDYKVNLPVAVGANCTMFTAHFAFKDASTTAYYQGQGWNTSNAGTVAPMQFYLGNAGGIMIWQTPTLPATVATGDEWVGEGLYEID